MIDLTLCFQTYSGNRTMYSPKHRAALSLARACCLATLIMVTWLSSVCQAVTYYANGNNINLATGRNNVFSTGGSIGGNSITAPLHPSYGNPDFRASNSANGPYWQVDFPNPYEVSNIFVETYSEPYGINTMNFQTTTDGSTWITQASPAIVNDGNGDYLTASFSTVSNVVGVRLVSTSWDNNSYPGIFRAIRITGPNTTIPLFTNGESEFSVTQATWNGGSVQSAVNWAPYSGGPSTIAPIDDFTTLPWNFNSTIYRSTDADPAPIDILLNDNYWVDSVGIATGNETGTGGRTATSVDISYSPDPSGPFIPLLTNVPLLGSPDGYYEIDLGGIFDTRRLRYDFAGSSASLTGGQTFIAELSAFAVDFTPAPEPSSMLLMLGVLGCGMLKRRKVRTASTEV